MMKLGGSNCETFQSSQGVLNHETSTIWRTQHNTSSNSEGQGENPEKDDEHKEKPSI
jgi:hypothetical protein